MIPRRLAGSVAAALRRQPGVVLLGPRQVGKTTLALEVASSGPSLYLDLESPADRAKLAEPELFLAAHADELVILDELQRIPELFATLRGVIDRGRRDGAVAWRGTGERWQCAELPVVEGGDGFGGWDRGSYRGCGLGRKLVLPGQ